MKFIHLSDVHWNAAPDSTMPWSSERQAAIKTSFQAVISVVKKENIPLLLISGDFIQGQPLFKDLNEINQLFTTIPDTKIVIIAGCCDYVRQNSPYLTFLWADHVTFFTGKDCTSIYFSDLNVEVHGFSQHSPIISEPVLNHITAPWDGRIHILLAYCDQKSFDAVDTKALQTSGFHYIALGGIHKPGSFLENKAAYPGSLEPLNKTEYGKHGYIAGEIGTERLSIMHVPLSKVQYISLILHLTPQTTNLELNTLIRSEIEKRGVQNIYRFKLSGFHKAETTFNFDDLADSCRIVEIIDETEPEYDYNVLCKEHPHDMVGLFIRTLKKPDMDVSEKKALFYGVKALIQTTNEGKSNN